MYVNLAVLKSKYWAVDDSRDTTGFSTNFEYSTVVYTTISAYMCRLSL